MLRVEKLATTGKGKFDQEVYEAILRVYFTDATSRIAKSGSDALVSFAEGDLLRTFLLGLKRFTRYTPANVKEGRRMVAETLISANEYCF